MNLNYGDFVVAKKINGIYMRWVLMNMFIDSVEAILKS